MLFHSYINFELCEKSDNEGRMLIGKLKIQSNTYVLCNIYALTQDHKLKQNNFIKNLKNELTSFASENILIGGDLNFYIEKKLDKIDSMININDNPTYRKEICALLHSMDLTDCLKNIYPNLRRYTWHARGRSSRLDYWFISENLPNELETYKILPGHHSDHSILKINLENELNNRGKGLWKFNTSLLHDTKYVEKVKKIIKDIENEFVTMQDRGLAKIIR